eukprot:c1206_g1_i1.p1 GENE.c1206_g1_i1~~c1206_g1_i1.p1  ORF type:complete len:780 (-),score=172.94 c1206_g1_i1:157-2244(-)
MCTQPTPHTKELYLEYGESVHDYCRNVIVDRLHGKRDEFLLQTLVKEYKNFKIFIRMMKNAFEYLNRFHVPRNSLQNLTQIGTVKFDDVVFSQVVGDDIQRAALQIIQRDRDGEKVDRQLIRDITNIYVELDIGGSANGNTKYEDGFEKGFLAESKTFYSARSVVWLQESLPEYLIKVENTFAREQKLAEECLPPSTLPKLEQALEKELLSTHRSTLLERETGGFSSLLTDMRKDDLRRMHILFSRIPDNLKPLASQFCSFVTKKGKELVETFEPSKVSVPEAVTEFVDKLIAMHDSYHTLLVDCFSNSTLFNKAMKEAFESFVNREMGPAGSKVTCAELLSMYCDTLLKSSGEKMSDDAIETTLEKVVQLFTYLSDKDLFSEFYRKQLARRLLQKKSASDDAEFRMLEMLKGQCGAQFTSKLEGMVKDLTMSKEHQQNFKEYLSGLSGANKLRIECEVQVLTTGYWPYYPIIEINLPTDIVKCIDAFKTCYEQHTKHRRLKWLHTMGQVTLLANFDMRYELTLSTPQACILMLFNAVPALTFDEVRGRLNLSDEEATRQLLTLSAGKFKLLKKEPAGKNIAPADAFSVNGAFKSDKKRIKVPTISSKELTKEDKDSTTQAVAEDRKHAIEAAIVRIMKSRKQLEFQKLVLETSQQLLRLFKPDVKLIKARMEDLISREYLERDPQNPKMLRYLA